jgi:hypothetical protein
MWPRAPFHSKKGKDILKGHLANSGVYVLYREDEPYYVGKTGEAPYKRLKAHALKPNRRNYNFCNHFSAFELSAPDDR